MAAQMAQNDGGEDEAMGGEPEDPTGGEMEDPAAQNPIDASLGEEPKEPVEHVSGDDITNIVASIEDLLASIKAEIGEDQTGLDLDGDGEAGEEFEGAVPEEGMGEEPPMEGGEEGGEEGIEFEDASGDEGEGESEESDEESDEEEPAPKKDKKPPFKKIGRAHV